MTEITESKKREIYANAIELAGHGVVFEDFKINDLVIKRSYDDPIVWKVIDKMEDRLVLALPGGETETVYYTEVVNAMTTFIFARIAMADLVIVS